LPHVCAWTWGRARNALKVRAALGSGVNGVELLINKIHMSEMQQIQAFGFSTPSTATSSGFNVPEQQLSLSQSILVHLGAGIILAATFASIFTALSVLSIAVQG
jgi:hypothetical protein